MKALPLEQRLKKVAGLQLLVGNHLSPAKGMCVMEAVAFVKGEKFSDSPECACPIIGSFLRAWNDSLPDEPRQRLLRYAVREVDGKLAPGPLIGSKSTPEVEQKRGLMMADWYIRVFTPTWLELAGLSEHAEALRTANAVTKWSDLDALQPKLEAARDQSAAARAAAWAAAWDAAWAAARAAAWDAAWAAAWAAARDAARDAAWDAARDAAWDAAWAAARAAAWDAAWAAARDAAWAATVATVKLTDGHSTPPASYDDCKKIATAALAPTVERLQATVFVLLDKMLEVKE